MLDEHSVLREHEVQEIEEFVQLISRRTERLSIALGLPREAKYAVLGALGGGAAFPTGLSQSTLITKERPAESSVISSASQAASSLDPREQFSHERLFMLVESFLQEHMQAQVTNFHSVWKVLRTLPIETIQRRLSQPTAALVGVGFTSGDACLPAVLAVTSWALSQARGHGGDALSALARDEIAKQAEGLGCSRAQSYALADYLIAQLA